MNTRGGVSNAVFAGTTVVLLIIAAIGYRLYLTSAGSGHTSTELMTETMGQTSTEVMTETMVQTSTVSSTPMEAVQFAPAVGQMVHSAWLLIQPTGSGEYALYVYAQGLESTQGTGNVYIVEGAQSSGAMSVIPVGPNATASEFETTAGGVGSYFVVLMQDPYTTFENIQIVYLPGMQMSNATVVATATLTMMSH